MLKKIIAIFLVIVSAAKAQTLNYFYGNIHSHTAYSDGNKDSASSLISTPLKSFEYAKQSLHTDFYGISEHNHESAGIKSAIYFNKGLHDADSITTDGQFVAMYGMEWGVISTGGHALIYGFDSLCGWDFGSTEIYVAQNDYSKLWKTVNRKKNCFAYLAHPQADDYNNLFVNSVDTSADKAIVGMAMRSGPAFSTNNTYSNPATSSTYIARYNESLSRGYHLGVGIDHDTHNSVFDRQSAGRLVVMAPLLNRAEIIEGIRKMRFYASDDWNVKVDFKINGLPMGSEVTNAGNPNIQVLVNDPDGENISTIKLYYGVPASGVSATLLSSVSNNNSFSYTHSISNNTSYYYYFIITQTDGNTIWTSPIWYNRNDGISVQVPNANFENNIFVCANTSIQLQDSSSNNPTSWWWTIPGAYPAQSSLQNPTVNFPTVGSYNVSLTVTNQAGVSNTITKTINVVSPPNLQIEFLDTICVGQIDTLIASGFSSYVWNNSATAPSVIVSPAFSTTYSVIGITGACKVQKSVSVHVTQALQKPTISVNADSLLSSFPYYNNWYFNGLLLVDSNLNFLIWPASGNYRVQAIDSLGCKSDISLLFPYTNTSSLNEQELENLFIIYPTPSNGIFYLQAKENIKNIAINICDATGQILLKQNYNDLLHANDRLEIDLRGYAKKMYFIRIFANDKVLISKISIE